MPRDPRTFPLPFVTLKGPADRPKATEADRIPVIMSLRKWIALTHLELMADRPLGIMPEGADLN